MKKKLLTILTGMVMIMASLLSPVGVAFAEADYTGGFIVSPPNQVIVLVPGESYTYTIQVTNPEAAVDSIIAAARVVPFTVQDTTDYSVDYQTKTNYNQIVDWITLEEPEIEIAPNSTGIITYRIDVPSDAPAGGQYASVNVQKKNTEDVVEGGANIKETMEIASLIYATVLGETTEAGEIMDNMVDGFSFDGKIKASVMAKNEGNVHSTLKSTLRVFPLLSNEEYYTNEDEPRSIVLIPNQAYYMTQQWEGPKLGIMRVVQTVEFAGEVSETQRFVIVCPMWVLFLVIAAIILALCWIFAKNNKKKKKEN